MAKKQTDEHSKTQQKPTDSNKMVTVEQSKRAGRILFSKYAANDWLMYNRSGKHAINLKCLLCCSYVECKDKLRDFKSE